MSRTRKTTTWQYELFVEELENNEIFQKKNSANMDIWKSLVEKLNTCGGPQRSLANWNRVFINWKSQIKKEAKRKTKKCIKETPNRKKMKELQARFLKITNGRTEKVPKPIVIENSDRIEFVNEEGTIIFNVDKLELKCEDIPSTVTKKQRQCRNKRGYLSKAFSQKNEILTELKEIKKLLEKQLKELQIQNEINKLRIEYERTKSSS